MWSHRERCCQSGAVAAAGKGGKGKGERKGLFGTRGYIMHLAHATCLGHAIAHHTAGGRRNRKRCVTSRSSCNSTASKWIPQRRLRPVLQLKPSLSLMPMSEAEITSCVAPDPELDRSARLQFTPRKKPRYRIRMPARVGKGDVEGKSCEATWECDQRK